MPRSALFERCNVESKRYLKLHVHRSYDNIFFIVVEVKFERFCSYMNRKQNLEVFGVSDELSPQTWIFLFFNFILIVFPLDCSFPPFLFCRSVDLSVSSHSTF